MVATCSRAKPLGESDESILVRSHDPRKSLRVLEAEGYGVARGGDVVDFMMNNMGTVMPSVYVGEYVVQDPGNPEAIFTNYFTHNPNAVRLLKGPFEGKSYGRLRREGYFKIFEGESFDALEVNALNVSSGGLNGITEGAKEIDWGRFWANESGMYPKGTFVRHDKFGDSELVSHLLGGGDSEKAQRFGDFVLENLDRSGVSVRVLSHVPIYRMGYMGVGPGTPYQVGSEFQKEPHLSFVRLSGFERESNNGSFPTISIEPFTGFSYQSKPGSEISSPAFIGIK